MVGGDSTCKIPSMFNIRRGCSSRTNHSGSWKCNTNCIVNYSGGYWDLEYQSTKNTILGNRRKCRFVRRSAAIGQWMTGKSLESFFLLHIPYHQHNYFNDCSLSFHSCFLPIVQQSSPWHAPIIAVHVKRVPKAVNYMRLKKKEGGRPSANRRMLGICQSRKIEKPAIASFFIRFPHFSFLLKLCERFLRLVAFESRWRLYCQQRP